MKDLGVCPDCGDYNNLGILVNPDFTHAAVRLASGPFHGICASDTLLVT